MPDIPMLDAELINRLVSMQDAINALRNAFAAGVTHAPRTHLHGPNGEFLAMPSAGPHAFGTKLVTVTPGNSGSLLPIIQGLFVLFDGSTGRPAALMDGAALTTLRTPAASAVATDALARHDVKTIGILGTGPQAAGHAHAMRVVRPSATEAVIAGRNQHRVAAVTAELSEAGFTVRAGSFEDAAGCDLVCTCTRAAEALFDRRHVKPGSHLNLVGSYRLDLREVASDVVDAATVVVDELEAAKAEAGDLAIAVAEGAWSWDRVAGDLSDTATGRVHRAADGEITLFKSVGLAVQDLIVAELAAARWSATESNQEETR
jgi:ornithine cyclodeaminase/alanine dehydrogenase-like protein (mu-crystallin family)